jgi:hypothetical protein
LLQQGVQDLLNVLQMFFPSSIEDEDVIQIYDHKRVCEQLQDIIHHPHECCRTICQPKGMTNHSKAFFRLEGGLPYQFV